MQVICPKAKECIKYNLATWGKKGAGYIGCSHEKPHREKDECKTLHLWAGCSPCVPVEQEKEGEK